MKLSNPNIEIIRQESGLEGIYKQIEKAGRTCYQSQDKITEDSAKGFADRMIKSGHGAMLEHGTVYLFIEYKSPLLNFEEYEILADLHIRYKNNKYSKVVSESDGFNTQVWITTNYRVIIENNWVDDLKYLCDHTEHHEKRITVKFTTAIDITREFNRHRINSMAESSTRYCNYSKTKFGNELTISTNIDISEQDVLKCMNDWGEIDIFRRMCSDIAHEDYVNDHFQIIDTWLFANLACEWSYMRLIKLGWAPQQARRVLPIDTHSELVHTAFESDWKHFMSLRSPKYGAKGVHPDAAYLGDKLYDCLV